MRSNIANIFLSWTLHTTIPLNKEFSGLSVVKHFFFKKKKTPKIAKSWNIFCGKNIYHEHLETNDGSGARKSKHMYNLFIQKKVKKIYNGYSLISFNYMYLEYHTSVISTYNDICSSLWNA